MAPAEMYCESTKVVWKPPKMFFFFKKNLHICFSKVESIQRKEKYFDLGIVNAIRAVLQAAF